MIFIEKIRTEVCSQRGLAYLIADIKISKADIQNWIVNMEKIEQRDYKNVYRTDYLKDEKFSIWYSVPLEYAESLCFERADAFVVALIYFAMVSGCDIKSNIPVSERLYYQLNTYMLPTMCNGKNGYRPIKIICSTLPEVKHNGEFVGTGASGGVDSFASIILGKDENLSEKFKITHLCYFNVGALNFSEYLKPYTLEVWNKNAQKEFKTRSDIAKKISDEFNLKLVTVDSNISDLYQGSFLYSVTYRTCSAVFATQKMWGKYYFASAGYTLDKAPSPALNSAFFDNFVLGNFNLDALTFYSSGSTFSRLEKTKLLLENTAAQKLLNVCSFETENCGECDKCIRTILALDVLGCLEKFSKAFKHVERYKKYKWYYWGMVRYAKSNNDFMYDIKEYIKENKILYPYNTWLYVLYKHLSKIKKFFNRCIR